MELRKVPGDVPVSHLPTQEDGGRGMTADGTHAFSFGLSMAQTAWHWEGTARCKATQPPEEAGVLTHGLQGSWEGTGGNSTTGRSAPRTQVPLGPRARQRGSERSCTCDRHAPADCTPFTFVAARLPGSPRAIRSLPGSQLHLCPHLGASFRSSSRAWDSFSASQGNKSHRKRDPGGGGGGGVPVLLAGTPTAFLCHNSPLASRYSQ